MPTPFPSWLQQAPAMGEMRSLYRSAPTAFDTKGVEAAYGQQMGLNMGQAQSTTSTMAKAAMNRASRTGGQVAGSFAAGSAMLPYMRQNAEMLGDLEDYKLRAIQNRMQMQAGLAGDMAALRQRQTGMLGDFYQAGENRGLASTQFNANLGQREREFAAQQGLALRRQDFDERRYKDALELQQSGGRGGGYGRGGNTPTWGEASTLMAAHNANNPSALAYWQRMRQAAGQGGYMDSEVFGTGY